MNDKPSDELQVRISAGAEATFVMAQSDEFQAAYKVRSAETAAQDLLDEATRLEYHIRLCAKRLARLRLVAAKLEG